MPASQRAWLYVTRNRKRTILLSLLFIVLMTVSLLSFALYTASEGAVRELRGSIGGYFTIHTGADGGGKADEALLEQVGTLEGIRAYNGVDTYYLYAEGLSLMPGSQHGTGTAGEFTPRFIGCTDSSLHERFLTNSFQLLEGRNIAPDDRGTAVISREVAQMNGLSVGGRITARVTEGVRDWIETADGLQFEYEIVGIYTTTRSEPDTPVKKECDRQENIIFTDIHSAKQLFSARFPHRGPQEYTYSSGIMLFLDDPAEMAAVMERMRREVSADWDGLLVFENSAAYQQAAAPLQKAAAVSRMLLAVLLALSVALLSLTLTLWTRERMPEFGVLISLGIPARAVCGQMLLENYLVAAPSFAVSLLLGALISGNVHGLLDIVPGELRIAPPQAAVVLFCSTAVIFATVLLAGLSILRRKPKAILTDLA